LQLGLSTYSFPWAIGVDGFRAAELLTPSQLVRYAATKEINHLQFGDNLPLHLFSTTELKDLREEAARLNVNVEVGTRRLTAENISNYLAIAQDFNSPFLRVVIDDADFHPTADEVKEIIKSILPELKATGVCLAIENHDRFPATVLQQIIQDTDPESVGICLDTANSLGANEGVNEVVAALGPYTVNLHIKDITIQRLSHKMGFLVEGCPAGKGILNIPYLINQLRQYKKCKTVTLEVWSQPEATIEQTIAKEKQWVETSIDYLKNII
jgi:sugar phosphate isomerase/epimerase